MSTANVRKFHIFIPLDVLNSQHECFILRYLTDFTSSTNMIIGSDDLFYFNKDRFQSSRFNRYDALRPFL